MMLAVKLFQRLAFARRFAAWHLLVSALVAAGTAALVLFVWYPQPFRDMTGVTGIFLLVLAVDMVCGPLLTLIISRPDKSRRERVLDFGLVGAIQITALAYGLHAVWVARPVVLAFEQDRLVVVTANEVDLTALPNAPTGLRQLPMAGVLKVGTRRAKDAAEMMESVDLGLAGVGPAMRPDWWVPWVDLLPEIRTRSKPLSELIELRPKDAALLREAATAAGADPAQLRYLPLTGSKTKDWTALLDSQGNMVGYAAVDAF